MNAAPAPPAGIVRMTPPTTRWLAGIVCLLGFAWYGANHSYPLLPGPVALTLTLPAGTAGHSSPLVTTGQTGTGTLLYLRYLAPTTVVFGYDSWAVGGPESAPIEITPGATRSFVIEMPSLAAPLSVDRRARGPLRVVYADREVLRGSVHYRGRAANEIHFARNPIGGTIATHAFPGVIATADGRILDGRPTAIFPVTARLWHWLTGEPKAVALACAVSLLGAFLLPFAWQVLAALWRRRDVPAFSGYLRPPHLTFAVTTAVCTGAFVAVVTGFSFRLFEVESFGRFYDDQIASLLAGRLDVPPEALDDEAFLFEGKRYGYFGPTPAVLRLPFALAGIGFGRLSRSYLLLYYLACLGAAYALLIHAARLLSGRPTWPARWHVVVLVGGAGLGSTLFFVGSRAYIYHEAILCGAAFALWGTWGCLRWLAAPAHHRWWLLALGCGILAVHARPPAGLFALACLGFSAAAILVRSWLSVPPFRWRRGAPTPQSLQTATSSRGEGTPPPARMLTPLLVGVLSILGVLSFNGLSYLKFKSFDGAPLRYHVQYHPGRLANLGGSNFHPANVPYGLDVYVWRPNFVLRPVFPYFYVEGRDPSEYPGSRLDLTESTLALPYAMPSLVFLAALAAWLALFRWTAARLPLAVLTAGAAPMTIALLAAIAVSHRYTGDFIPFLLGLATFGLAGIAVFPPAARQSLAVFVSLLTVAAVFITVALTLHYQGEVVWGVPDEVRAHYLSWRQTMDRLFGFSRP